MLGTMSATAAEHDPWTALDAELDAWAAAGRRATFWWRDDDATQPGPRLDRLLGLAVTHGVPLCLAVVPQPATDALRETLHSTSAEVAVVQHGYAHQNHAASGEKSMELGGHRPAAHVIAELAVGQERLTAWPGFVPMMVPPWNRIAPHLVPLLPELGYTALSTIDPRPSPRHGALALLNVHVDLIAWGNRNADGTAPFIGDEAAIAAIVAHLAARRTGTADADEPTGVMTHHRDHDVRLWRFIEGLLSRTVGHPAVEWLTVAQALRPQGDPGN